MARIQFKIKDGGTGSVLYTIELGYDTDDASFVVNHANWRVEPSDDGLVRYVVSTFYFAAAPTSDATEISSRVAAAKYAEDLRVACYWRPPVVKTLARGRVVLPNIYNNFGDLSIPVPATTLLANCCLESAKVSDDVGIHGVGIDLTFVKASVAVLAL